LGRVGFLGVLLVLFVGSFIDRVRVYGSGGMNPLQNALRHAVFLSMGKLAKADGHSAIVATYIFSSPYRVTRQAALAPEGGYNSNL
jgi:hypothetical protein